MKVATTQLMKGNTISFVSRIIYRAYGRNLKGVSVERINQVDFKLLYIVTQVKVDLKQGLHAW